MCYFLEYIWIFFPFSFVLFFIFIEKKVPSPQRERRSQMFWRGEERGMRRGEQMGGGGERRRRGGGRGSIFLSSLSRSFSLHQCGASLWHTSVMRKIPPACLVSGRWRWPVWVPPVCSCPRPSSSSGTPATSRGRRQTRRPLLLPLSPLMTERNRELK